MNDGISRKGIRMLKTQIILIALAVSWFLCSERPQTDEQISDGKTAVSEGNTIAETNNSVAEHDAPESEDKILTGKRVRYGALIVLIIAASRILKHFDF